MNIAITAKKISILVVDDLADNLQILVKTLSKQGYQVRCAKNGFTALRGANTIVPDLILLDIKMPKMTGLELLAELNSRGLLNHQPPIIVYTSSNMRKDIEAVRRYPGIRYQTKPEGYLEGKAWLGTIIDQLNLEKLPK